MIRGLDKTRKDLKRADGAGVHVGSACGERATRLPMAIDGLEHIHPSKPRVAPDVRPLHLVGAGSENVAAAVSRIE